MQTGDESGDWGALLRRRRSDINADLLSILPDLEMHGFWERIIQPVCSGVMMTWSPPASVNSPDKPNASANGAFMLMRKRSTKASAGTKRFATK